jgi:hypothetical protein
MANVLKAGIFYFLGVFTLGFILGAMRIFFLVPYTGPAIAVLIEIPLMLLFAWYFCRFLIRRCEVPPETYDRLVMGGVAFALLIAGEMMIALLLQGGSVAEFFVAFDLPENRIGLGAQIAFALFPLVQSYAENRGEL